MTAISIAIPTFNRGQILLATIEHLLALEPRADAILIADQTREHPSEVEERLRRWDAEGVIRWMRLPEPSIPRAMNDLLVAATTPLVLFFDDDIIPGRDIVRAHRDAHRDPAVWAVVGQVLQPGETTSDYRQGRAETALAFAFVMAGNLSVKRERALEIGGFDENFIGAAYRFETDFALRIAAAGGRIDFHPAASLRHLQLSTGGLRSYGDHRSAPVAAHSAGDYYFALHHARHFWPYALRRLRQNVGTRHLATHPWRIPGKLIGEIRGLLLARSLRRKGRRLRVVAPESPS